MKSTELMIGDIILVGVIPRIVAQITKHKIGYHRTELPFGECKMTYARLEDITPIPLTPEILEKNGWERFGCRSILRHNKRSLIIHHYGEGLCFLNYSMKDVPIMIPSQYVHELQRALRCCGLNELADNFKVE